jgi:hypothetical protein
MYDSNREAAIEFIRGAAVTILVMGGFLLFVVLIGEPDNKPREKFEVVDHYGTCAVVRYNRQEEGRYTYFLDCREVR